jgi:hypothetical protein
MIKSEKYAKIKSNDQFDLHQKECNKAMEELKGFQNQVIKKSFYTQWIKDYKPVFHYFKQFPLDYISNNDFYSIYLKFEELFDNSLLDPLAEKALKSYQELDLTNEKTLIEWFLRYERLGLKVCFIYLEKEPDTRSGQFEYFWYDALKIDASDFIFFFQLRTIFQDKYEKMRKKYLSVQPKEEEGGTYVPLSEILRMIV